MHSAGRSLALAAVIVLVAAVAPVCAEGDWEVTTSSREALDRGLAWLAQNQGPNGNWDTNELGLVSLGALSFLADGHTPGRGKYGAVIDKALDYVLRNAKPSGLLNISTPQHDMYNHGLSAFVLGQAHGMTPDPRLGPVLDRALKLIANTQCDDGGWDYRARRTKKGHDLSLAVMQAKALRSAVDSGLEVPPEVIELAIKSVRGYYRAEGASKRGGQPTDEQALPGRFTYNGGGGTVAMAAAGVVCLQEFGQYEDWRIAKNIDVLTDEVKKLSPKPNSGDLPFEAYAMYYVGQAIYQRGGQPWKAMYPKLRDTIAANQLKTPGKVQTDGSWRGGRVDGKGGTLYGTSVACFVLAIPNRYLPILQEGKIDSLRRFQEP